MLKPQYTRRPFNILLLGPPLSGKRTLATQLLKTKDVFYQIFTAESIPKKPLSRIDYVFIMVDMTQNCSLTLLDQLIKRMQDRFLVTKMAVLVTKMDKRNRWQFEVEQVQELIRSVFDVHVFYVNFMNELEKKKTVDQLSRLVKTSTLQYKNTSSILLNSVHTYVMDDLEDDENWESDQETEDTEGAEKAEESKSVQNDKDMEEVENLDGPDEGSIDEPMSGLKIEDVQEGSNQ